MGIEVFPLPATGPSLAEITTAITTNAAPSSVTMPAITSSITTNAASSGVTLAAIGTQVANNASPYGGTWADISTFTTGNQTTATISGLGSYKYIRFTYIASISAANNVFIRFNGDTGGNYAYGGQNSSQQAFVSPSLDSQIYAFSAVNTQKYGFFEIYGSNSTSMKKVVISRVQGEGANPSNMVGVWNSTAAITSITMFVPSGNMGNIYWLVQGAN